MDNSFQENKVGDKIRNVFISHHHKDDKSVDELTNMIGGKGYNLRNSSIRVKPDNEKRLQQNKVSDAAIRRLLRMKLRWASTLIVVIGKETHSRDWVNWEIEAANKLGMPIIGVYENGLKEKVPVPEKLEDYSAAVVGWRSAAIIDSLEGKPRFENPDGSAWPNRSGGRTTC